jgi:site-specific recombinase XerD
MANTNSSRTLEALVDLYLVSCEVEGRSPNTLRAYKETLSLFLRAATELDLPLSAAEIKPDHIYRFLSWVMQRGVSLPTRHRRFREVRCFFNWARRMNYIHDHPFEGLRNVKLGQKIVQPFTTDQVTRLLEGRFPTPYLEARNKAIIWLLLDTGIRLNELCSLKLEDLDITTQRLRVLQGKGNKQRVVRVGDEAMDKLRDYLDNHRRDGPGPLFLTDEGKAMSRNAVRVMLVRLGERTNVDHVYPHRFRHTFATWAIENEAREIDVQYLLGHSTPDMVRRYSATYNSEKAAQAHASWSPGGILARQIGPAMGGQQSSVSNRTL